MELVMSKRLRVGILGYGRMGRGCKCIPETGAWDARRRYHLRELRSETPDVLAAYVAMARATAERALAAGRLAPTSAEALLEAVTAYLRVAQQRGSSEPGRIAAANVSARSSRTMMLRTFQSPNASAATAIAPAAALAAVTAMSGRRSCGAGLGSRVAMREDDA
jgi:hypothetical protein